MDSQVHRSVDRFVRVVREFSSDANEDRVAILVNRVFTLFTTPMLLVLLVQKDSGWSAKEELDVRAEHERTCEPTRYCNLIITRKIVGYNSVIYLNNKSS